MAPSRVPKRSVLGLLGLVIPCLLISAVARNQVFSVSTEIELAHFGDPYQSSAEPFGISPNGAFFAVHIERGRLEANLLEDTLSFYNAADIARYVVSGVDTPAPLPVWSVSLSTSTVGPVISNWRWLRDSSGIALLRQIDEGHQQLMLADLRTKHLVPLTDASERVRGFDVVNSTRYAYTVVDSEPRTRLQSELRQPAIVATGRSIFELLIPSEPRLDMWLLRRSNIRAAFDGKRSAVETNGKPLQVYGDNIYPSALALSPDGRFLVTTRLVSNVPQSWVRRYPPPFPQSPVQLRAGQQDPTASPTVPVNQYLLVNLKTGIDRPLQDAPTSFSAGWFAGGNPQWSTDGRKILLPGAYATSDSGADDSSLRPCVTVVDAQSFRQECVEALKGRTSTGIEEGSKVILGMEFVRGDATRVRITAYRRADEATEIVEYQRAASGVWRLHSQAQTKSSLQLTIKQGLNEPPRLFASIGSQARMVLDPNSELSGIELGHTEVFEWQDREGRAWRGGLYQQHGRSAGERYPLVIQTHGFVETEFRPSGIYPTAFAARALAAAGIAVLQVDDNKCPQATPQEGRCALMGYEAAVEQLSRQGLIDPQKLGIVGFSRTCYYAMAALTSSSLRFSAASITEGVMESYSQYLISLDAYSGMEQDANSVIGTAPFGPGLQQWLDRSPTFNLHKVNAPLLVVANGPLSVLHMWEPYAGLRYLGKPAEFVMLNTSEHVLSNPRVRLVSQQGTVDWFRFWLQDREDPAEEKKDQYQRWRRMKGEQGR